MTGIIVEGTLAFAKDGDISFEALQKFGKTGIMLKTWGEKFEIDTFASWRMILNY
ncbi:hypothetical protein MHJ94_09945 [Chryseobacterium taklimakanense]|uniref:hypothetical protein n=1 Tax=Chryseobacterium taklimakanense TaxID=536441 RepID=UPI001EF69CD7|nr:hypothetical protein [Chryseobacterium taklimakanense]MCG7281612.1 hypothetical protein [Chryseobacterium taklimakanense]